jgi:hypothetical protein
MARTTGLLILFDKCVRTAEEASWNDWYDSEYLPDLGAEVGPWVSTRWELTERPRPGLPGIGFTHTTILELDSDAPTDQASAILDRVDAARQRGAIHSAHAAVGAEVFVAHGPWADKPEPSSALNGHILTQVLCTDPSREAEWDAWYDDMHVPDMLSCGAFSAMTRWRREPRPRVGSGFLTLYDVSAPTVADSVSRSAVTLAEIVAAGRKLDTHTGALTLTLQPAGRYGGAGYRPVS